MEGAFFFLCFFSSGWVFCTAADYSVFSPRKHASAHRFVTRMSVPL